MSTIRSSKISQAKLQVPNDDEPCIVNGVVKHCDDQNVVFRRNCTECTRRRRSCIRVEQGLQCLRCERNGTNCVFLIDKVRSGRGNVVKPTKRKSLPATLSLQESESDSEHTVLSMNSMGDPTVSLDQLTPLVTWEANNLQEALLHLLNTNPNMGVNMEMVSPATPLGLNNLLTGLLGVPTVPQLITTSEGGLAEESGDDSSYTLMPSESASPNDDWGNFLVENWNHHKEPDYEKLDNLILY